MQAGRELEDAPDWTDMYAGLEMAGAAYGAEI